MNRKVLNMGVLKVVLCKKNISMIVCCAVILSVLFFSYILDKCSLYSENFKGDEVSYRNSAEEYVVEHNETKEIEEKDISRVHATYKFDVKKVENIVSDADYTFVATVEKVLGTVYKFPVKLEDKMMPMPYTKIRL